MASINTKKDTTEEIKAKIEKLDELKNQRYKIVNLKKRLEYCPAHLDNEDEAKEFFKHWKDDIRFCYEKGWLQWDNTKWVIQGIKKSDDECLQREVSDFLIKQRTEAEEEYNLCKTTAKYDLGAMSKPDIQKKKDEDSKNGIELCEYFEFVYNYKNKVESWINSRKNLVELIRTNKQIYIDFDLINKNKNIVTFINKTYDLKTFDSYMPRKDDYSTQALNYYYQEDVEYGEGKELWDRVLNEFFMGDEEVKEYFLKSVGYALFGSATPLSFFMPGNRDSGKSLILNTIAKVLRGYAKCLKATDLFDKDKQGAFLVGLETVRILVAAEGDVDTRLPSGNFKSLVSQDPQTVNPKFLATYEFTPNYTIFFHTNYLPHLDGNDDAIAKRIVVIPINNNGISQIETGGINPVDYLVEKCGTYIANMIVLYGLIASTEATKGRLSVPEKLVEAKKEYMIKENIVEQFIIERCVTGKSQKIKRSTLYKEFVTYYHSLTDSKKTSAMNRQSFYLAMESKGYKTVWTHAGETDFDGIDIKNLDFGEIQ